ncbi:DNA glycosylase AlkZ-like family protein [Gluconacetobacter dulcium]|uniref:Uncharacterized protein n=1 Tax=Gluconacetobacter dulcium TaxID=2729096 RepID=A0A7W4K3N5_9PROT|nr:crosslink repair DNA glycosylase YcaQ family protein [Gluconacetobacter dulcium]MBB2199791.1 hypothetical protein [Gluconacetobacter dulcium]
MKRLPDPRQVVARPYEALGDSEREAAHARVMLHIRDALYRGPHGVLELRAGLSAEEAGALPVVLSDMVRAGEITALGHSVYARVPWMPATRPVTSTPIQDLVFAALTRHGTPEMLATWLGLTQESVKAALGALERAGLVQESYGRTRRGHWRIVSQRMASHIRRGAQDRVFADVAPHE